MKMVITGMPTPEAPHAPGRKRPRFGAPLAAMLAFALVGLLTVPAGLEAGLLLLLLDRQRGVQQVHVALLQPEHFADPVRLRLMSLIASHPGGEACVCDLNEAFDLTQPTISHHLKLLHEAGLLDREKRGVWVYYRARTQALASLGALIGESPR